MNKSAQIVNIDRGKQQMPSKNGYVSLWRDIAKQPWYSDPVAISIFVDLLITASHQTRVIMFKGVNIQLLEGQVITTRKILGDRFKIISDSKVKRTLEMFEKLGQITRVNRKSKGRSLGQIITVSNWEKWQKMGALIDQPIDQPVDQPIDQLNNTYNNNYKDHACFENKPTHLVLRQNAFEHFWRTWSDAKKLINRTNTAPKSKTKDKFLKIFTDAYLNKIGLDAFELEIDAMCELVTLAHNDICQKLGSYDKSDYFNYSSMYPALFITNKQWRDTQGEQA